MKDTISFDDIEKESPEIEHKRRNTSMDGKTPKRSKVSD